jgi:hypothetical protein
MVGQSGIGFEELNGAPVCKALSLETTAKCRVLIGRLDDLVAGQKWPEQVDEMAASQGEDLAPTRYTTHYRNKPQT